MSGNRGSGNKGRVGKTGRGEAVVGRVVASKPVAATSSGAIAEPVPRDCKYKRYPGHYLIVCPDCLGFPTD